MGKETTFFALCSEDGSVIFDSETGHAAIYATKEDAENALDNEQVDSDDVLHVEPVEVTEL